MFGNGYRNNYNNVNNGINNGGVSPTKKSIKDYIGLFLGASSIEMVDDFDTPRTRHICHGGRVISLLGKNVVPVPTTKGIINAEVFVCPNCKKVIVNSSSIEVY